MYSQLPSEIDPFRLARQGAKFAGHIALHRLVRLTEILGTQQGDVEVQIEVGQEEELGFVYIRGHIKTNLQLMCQRCGEAMDYAINVDLKLSPVLMDSQAATVSKEYEPWVTNGPISVLELVEEELLLGLPMIAKHKLEECNILTINELE